MMNDPGWTRIDAALARFLDGEPEPEDAETLAAAMAGDRDFAREVRRLLTLDDLLRQDALPDDRAFVESLTMRLGQGRDDGAFLRRFRRLPRLEKVKVTPRAWGIAAAVVLVCVSLSVLVVGRDRRGKNEPADQTRSDLPDRTVAVLTRVVDARWEPADFSIDEGSALSPGRLHLAEGLVQIEFISGAGVILEGPCDFELLSANRAVCHRGKLRAHVPPAAKGFTIAASGIDAVDLGTEFTLKVDDRGQGQIHVLDGAVQLHAAGERSPIQGIKTLTAGQGVEYGPGNQLRELVGDPAGIVDRSRLLELEHTHQQQRYRAWLTHSQTFRTDPDLLLYYTFEEANTWERTLRNVASPQVDGSRNGAVVGCLWCPGRWPEKSALEFKRTSDRVRINVPGEFDQLSLTAWVRMEGLNYWLSALMLTDGWELGEVHWQITANGELLLGVSLPDTRDGDGHRSPPVLGPKDLGRWVHLAAVYDKQTNLIAHYLDGKRVSQGLLRVPTTMRIGPANLGNWNPYPDFLKNSRRSLNGRIDEFAILRRALTDDEVRQMYEMGKPNS
ncbi:MAG: hypothetical protein P4L84_21310 [Isosphaeraceae bacterium]|nr:hypothetical protein [Isosphaeraceae bacterium]